MVGRRERWLQMKAILLLCMETEDVTPLIYTGALKNVMSLSAWIATPLLFNAAPKAQFVALKRSASQVLIQTQQITTDNPGEQFIDRRAILHQLHHRTQRSSQRQKLLRQPKLVTHNDMSDSADPKYVRLRLETASDILNFPSILKFWKSNHSTKM